VEKEKDSQSFVKEQTNWAHERTRLAKERTFASWLRTGLSATAVGLALMKLLPPVEPQWLLHVIGILFVGAGCIIFVMGYRTYHIVIKKLEKEGFRGIPSAVMGVLTFTLLLGAILGLVLIIMD
jgi:putative membrane protein